jgi:hypothetical protein
MEQRRHTSTGYVAGSLLLLLLGPSLAAFVTGPSPMARSLGYSSTNARAAMRMSAALTKVCYQTRV